MENILNKKEMFKNGVKNFWATACNTIIDENTKRIGFWEIKEHEDGLFIEWFSCDNLSMGKKIYKLERIVENGLEGKKNFLFFTPYSDEK